MACSNTLIYTGIQRHIFSSNVLHFISYKKMQDKFILVVQAQIQEARKAEWLTAELLVAMIYDNWLPDLSSLVHPVSCCRAGYLLSLAGLWAVGQQRQVLLVAADRLRETADKSLQGASFYHGQPSTVVSNDNLASQWHLNRGCRPTDISQTMNQVLSSKKIVGRT